MIRLHFLSITAFVLFAFNFGGKPSFKLAFKSLEGFCNYVPSGTAVIENDTMMVQSFYMSNEITNLQYTKFLEYLETEGRTEDLAIAMVDSNAWNTSFPNAFYKPMGRFYHSHPAYFNYPVVNISKQGAELFCEYLNTYYDSLSGGELRLKFRIPTRAEYIRAARGINHSQIYSWTGSTLYRTEGKCVFIGQVQANCIRNGAECITRNQETGKLEFIAADYPPEDLVSDGTFIIAPSKSYWPNDFGFYNINGNVAEMISDGPYAVGGDWQSPGYDIRNESIKSFDKPHPTIGFRVVATYFNPEK